MNLTPRGREGRCFDSGKGWETICVTSSNILTQSVVLFIVLLFCDSGKEIENINCFETIPLFQNTPMSPFNDGTATYVLQLYPTGKIPLIAYPLFQHIYELEKKLFIVGVTKSMSKARGYAS